MPNTIRVMISSRSFTPVFGEGTALADLRKRLRQRLQALRWADGGASLTSAPAMALDQPLFEVWIHECDPGEAADASTLEISLREIRRADIVLVLYTGEAGWAVASSEMGICHAELHEALERRGDVVSLIELGPLPKPATERDRRFRAWVDGLNLFRRTVHSEEELSTLAVELLHERVVELAHSGASGARRRDRGQALDWAELELGERRAAMTSALADILGVEVGPDGVARIELAGRGFTARLDAIPAALSVPAARELVGQPFLRDHDFADRITEDAPGILHLVACQRGVTEAQASRILGTPDAVIVASDFGVYAADHVHKIQLVLLSRCSDEGGIDKAIRRLAHWLRESGSLDRIHRRAHARRRILAALATEMAGETE